MNISLQQAATAVQAAIAKATQLDTLMNIAVVDTGVNLVTFARMDNAWLGSIDIAIKKARTAGLFDMESGELGKISQPGTSCWQLEHSNGGMITFPGGVPIRNNAGEIIGAIGVSGSTVENDHAVAQAGADAV